MAHRIFIIFPFIIFESDAAQKKRWPWRVCETQRQRLNDLMGNCGGDDVEENAGTRSVHRPTASLLSHRTYSLHII